MILKCFLAPEQLHPARIEKHFVMELLLFHLRNTVLPYLLWHTLLPLIALARVSDHPASKII